MCGRDVSYSGGSSVHAAQLVPRLRLLGVERHFSQLLRQDGDVIN